MQEYKTYQEAYQAGYNEAYNEVIDSLNTLVEIDREDPNTNTEDIENMVNTIIYYLGVTRGIYNIGIDPIMNVLEKQKRSNN